MQIIEETKVGPYRVKIGTAGGGYEGVLIEGAKVARRDTDTDLNALSTRLRNAAGKLHPDYLGMDGAVARFLHFFPGGFDDKAFGNERDYKADAQRRLQNLLPLEQASAATADQALAVRKAFSKTNVLHSTEFARAHEVLGGETGPAYVRSAARFATGELDAGLAGMAAAIAPRGRASWPLLTYLPSLWRPEAHMFLKPDATVDYARRIGHRFQFDYAAEPNVDVYRSLLDLVEHTEATTKPLGSQSRTDVQSFIWVVGDYTDADLPHLEKLRASA